MKETSAYLNQSNTNWNFYLPFFIGWENPKTIFTPLSLKTWHCTSGLSILKMKCKNTLLLHNGGFCNGCITKRILLLQAFHSWGNQYYQIMTKNIKISIYLIFYHRNIVKLDHFYAALAESTVCSSTKNTCLAEFRTEPNLTMWISSFFEHGALLKIIVNLKRSLLFGRSFMKIQSKGR